MVLSIEIKGDEELREPSEENIKKYAYAIEHFNRVNQYQEKQGESLRYGFHFLSPKSFNKFFTSLKDGTVADYKSDLDVKLEEPD